MSKRIFLSIVAFVSLAMAVWGCGKAPVVDKIQQQGTVLVGTTGDYRPLSFWTIPSRAARSAC